MYTVGAERLPQPDASQKAFELIKETLRNCRVVRCTADVLVDTDEPGRYGFRSYGGVVLGLIAEPPSITLMLEEAEVQTAACDCAYSDINPLSDFELSRAASKLSAELDAFAGTETKDPHFDDLPEEIGSVITIRFDHIGWSGGLGVMDHTPDLET